MEDTYVEAFDLTALSLAVRILCGFVVVLLLARMLRQRLAKHWQQPHSSEGLPLKPRSPRLTGWSLQLAVKLLQSRMAGPIVELVLHRNGITSGISNRVISEPPAFQSCWPVHSSSSADHSELVKTVTLPSGIQHVGERITSSSLAAQGSQLMKRGKDLRSGPAGGYWQIADYQHVYSRGIASCVDVMQNVIEALDKCQAMQPPMNLLISRDTGHILEQAQASRRRYQQGAPLSPLDGVPFAVIDCLHAGPYPTTAGTKQNLRSRHDRQDAPCMAALMAAGAILIGKANLHEIGVGMTGLNPNHGPCRNPHNPRHIAGGSSSGCAAIVASGICPFAIGIDGGGSLRVPAALCGVVGLKPTVGRSSADGCTDKVTSIMSIGPITASVADAMLVHSAIANAGCTHAAPITIPHQLVHSRTMQAGTTKPAPLRLGVHRPWFEDARPEVVSACKQALEVFTSQTGCQIVPIEIRFLEAARAGQLISVGASLAQAYKQLLTNKRSSLGPDTLATLLVAQRFTACDLLQAQQVRTLVMSSFADAFQKVDVIVTPTAPITAPIIRRDSLSHGELNMMLAGELMRFTNAVNMAGLPAISVPIGPADNGLPVGLQLVGQPWQEASLLYVSSALEAAVALQAHSAHVPPKVLHNVLKGLF